MWVEYRVCGLEEPRYRPQPRLLGLGLYALHCVRPCSASQLQATMPQPLCSTPAIQQHESTAAHVHHATTTAAGEQHSKPKTRKTPRPSQTLQYCPCQTGRGAKPPDTAHPSLSPAASQNQPKALLPPSAWLCSRLHLASIIQC